MIRDSSLLARLKVLEAICCLDESLELRVDWDRLDVWGLDSEKDFFSHEEDQLTGYLGLSAIHPPQAEALAFVHPHFRRQGRLRRLIAAAAPGLSQRGVEALLFKVEAASQSGTEAMRALRAERLGTRSVLTFTGKKQFLRPLVGLAVRTATRAEAAQQGSLWSEPGQWGLWPERGQAVLLVKNDVPVAGLYACDEADRHRLLGLRTSETGTGLEALLVNQALAILGGLDDLPIEAEVETLEEGPPTFYENCGFVPSRSVGLYRLSLPR